jgi:hypothetical protein
MFSRSLSAKNKNAETGGQWVKAFLPFPRTASFDPLIRSGRPFVLERIRMTPSFEIAGFDPAFKP